MEHEVLSEFAGERIDDLFVLAGAERGDDERLVSPRVNSALPCARGSSPTSTAIGRHRPRVTTVDPVPVGENAPSDHLLLDLLEHFVETLEN